MKRSAALFLFAVPHSRGGAVGVNLQRDQGVLASGITKGRTNMHGYWIAIVAIVGFISMVIAIIYAAAQTKQKQAQLRADVQMKLIERFGTADDFVRFVKSDEGREFLGNGSTVARKGLLMGLRSGIILAFLGVAFLLSAFVEREGDFYVPAFILLALGAGFFISAVVSMRLAKEMEKHDELKP